MDQIFLDEVEQWIADDPDPKNAAQLQLWLDADDEINLRNRC